MFALVVACVLRVFLLVLPLFSLAFPTACLVFVFIFVFMFACVCLCFCLRVPVFDFVFIWLEFAFDFARLFVHLCSLALACFCQIVVTERRE